MSTQRQGNELLIGPDISIPRTSFTAFRLTYCNPKEIYESSRVVSIGPIPHLWLGSSEPCFLKKFSEKFHIVTKAKQMVGLVDNMIGGSESVVDGVGNFYATEDLEPGARSPAKRGSRIRRTRSEQTPIALDFFLSHDSASDDSDEEDDDLRRTRSLDSGMVGSVFSAERHMKQRLWNAKSDALLLLDHTDADLQVSNKDVDSLRDSPRDSLEDSLRDSSSESFVTANEYNLESTPDDQDSEDSVNDEVSEHESNNDNANDNETIQEASVRTFNGTILTSGSTEAAIEKPEVVAAVPPPPGLQQHNGILSRTSSVADGARPIVNAVSFSSPVPLVRPKTGLLKRRKSAKVLHDVLPEPEFITDAHVKISTLKVPHFKLQKQLRKRAVWARARFLMDINRVERTLKLDRFFSSFVKGEVIKVEKMLVMVLGDDNIRESTTGDRILERWKEYVVVARSRNDYEEPLLVQFFKDRDISIVGDVEQTITDLDFKVNISSTTVRPYSALDKNLCVTIKKGDQKVRYILQCQAQSSSLKWLHLFQMVLGQSSKGQVTKIFLPHLHLSLGIRLPKDALSIKFAETANSHTLELSYNPIGYKVSKLPIYDYIIDVIMAALKTMNPDKVFSQRQTQRLLELTSNHSSLAFAWRHYDRLEWVFGENLKYLSGQILEQTHDLELRQMVHYSRHVLTTDGLLIHEPPPVEGFLALLTNRGGSMISALGRNVYRLVYCFTNDNLLMFTRFSNAVPYFERPDIMSPTGEVLDAAALQKARQSRPLVSDVSMYPLDSDDHVTWLNPEMSKEDFERNDRRALLEMERRAAQVVRASGMVDLCDVLEIKALDSSQLKHIVNLAGSLAWTGAPAYANDDSFKDSSFEVIRRDGTRLVFQAFSSEVRQEWMDRLRSISEYWTNRKREDMIDLVRVRERNMDNLNVDEYTESTIAESTSKWENSMGSADPHVYPITSHAMTRTVVRCGILYQKPKRHSAFRKYYVVLCPGFLLLYRMFRRSARDSTIKPTTYYRRYMSIPLKDCYIYSGESTALDLLKRNTTFDHLHPGHHSLPRVYPDGWKSSEEEPSRCFTIWFGSKRVLVQNSKDNDGNPGIIRAVNRLGVTGRSAVFMARSRQERDIWATNIFVEIERFSAPSHSEINLR
ncbi:unnamed protein product [Kuraishia capsulata CBS 1993]|uniref:PH domain-containing protein n=1 Tax=Kuraishia capsulata CBS 1993 TaxID=1382522 RepID=W6MSB6_9ASCO|nr:uncharacterized protein KUCA_T00005684001 [Kuraishia capsulata CBS 1993]CDK29691.1 unnamed protein product [Kuraishia capsulata CBS 1993]